MSVDQGTNVSLTAVADPGWTFLGFGGGCSGSGACTVKLSSDLTVWATFQAAPVPIRHNLSYSSTGAGSGQVTSSPPGIDCTSSCSAQFDAGTTAVLTATAQDGSACSGWSQACSGTGPCSVTVNSDVAVVASFAVTPPPTDDCAGLTPGAVLQPTVKQLINDQHGASCRPGASDGSGNLSLKIDAEGQSHGSFLHLFDPSGLSLGRYVGMQSTFFAQLDGFEGSNVYGRDNGSDVLAVDPRGSVVGTTGYNSSVLRYLAEDPTGGVVAVVHGPSNASAVEAYDARAQLRWRVAFPSNDQFLSLGVDRLGNTLLLLDGNARYGTGAAAGQWIDHQGKVGPEFKALDGLGTNRDFNSLVFFPRISSNLFLQHQTGSLDYLFPGTIHSNWLRQFDSLASMGSTPPGWLTSRADTKLHMDYGARAYAMIDLPRKSSPDCSQRIEIVAPSGKSCGAAAFTVGLSACNASSIDVGYDGTVIQQLPFEIERQIAGDPNDHTCTWRWWTGFFR